MGYMQHHAILVTSWNEEAIKQAHAEASRLFGAVDTLTERFRLVSPILGPAVNNYRSFFVAPDGSKEGWKPSNQGDELRKEFLAWLRSRVYDDGSSVYDWAHVQYGDDDGDQRILEATHCVVGPEGNLVTGTPT
jgi:hypothetical protein